MIARVTLAAAMALATALTAAPARPVAATTAAPGGTAGGSLAGTATAAPTAAPGGTAGGSLAGTATAAPTVAPAHTTAAAPARPPAAAAAGSPAHTTVAALARAPGARARTRVIADGGGATGLTAYGGHLVWNQRDARTRRWRLVHWHAGKQSRLAVPARAVPFDADAGPDAEGHPIVVFSQCARDPNYEVSWLAGRGCRVFTVRLDVPDAPHAVPGADAPGTSATTPSSWNGSLAFVRHTDGAFSSKVMLLRPGAPAPVPLPGATLRCDVDCDDRRILTTVESLDLGPRAAAFVWRQSGGDTIGIDDEWFLQTDPLDGSPPHELSNGFVDGACGFVYPFAPTVVGVGAFWVAAGSPCEETQTVFGQVDPVSGHRRVARVRAGLILGATRDGATTYWLRASRKVDGQFPSATVCVEQRAACKIMRSPSLPWHRLRPGQPLGPRPEEG